MWIFYYFGTIAEKLVDYFMELWGQGCVVYYDFSKNRILKSRDKG